MGMSAGHRPGPQRGRWTAALALALLPLAAGSVPASQTRPAPVAFVGIDVVPMDSERVLKDQTVVVRDGRIVAFGPRADTPLPRDATRVDGRGRYLLPGLADMHAHLSGYVTAAGSDKYAIARSELLLYVATGVTMVRNMAGSPEHLDYRRRVADVDLLGPRIYTTTQVVDGPNPVWPFAVKMGDPAEAEPFVAQAVHDGYDQVKIYNELPRAVYAALFDASVRHGIKVVGHVPFSVGIDAALAAGQYSIEHQRGYDYDFVRPQALLQNGGRNAERFGSWQQMSDDRMRDLVRKTLVAGTWNCPTFVIDDMMASPERRAALARDPLIRFVHPDVRETIVSNDLDKMFLPEATMALRASLPQRYKLLRMLRDAGAGLLIGTDSMVPYLVPGFTVIDEMQHFVDAGLTPYQALRAATADPARFLGIESDSGTIALHKRADLLLVEANPLEDVRNLWRRSGVVLNGRWIANSELSRMLDALAAGYPKSKAATEGGAR
jgi:imidazolonepropionase-like amidohydrolase